MEQVRQIAHRVQHAVGDGAGVVEGIGRTAGAVDGALSHGELDFDRRQRLTDFVVQLAGDGPSLLFLRVEQLRREMLEVAGVLHVLRSLPPKPVFETAGVERGEQRDAEAGREGDAQTLPDPTLRDAVDRRRSRIAAG